MVERVKTTIKKYNLLNKGDKIVVGISGGGDSVFLLWVLNQLKEEYQLKLITAHLNHMLRKEAKEEEKFVKKVSEKFGLPIWIERIEVKEFAKKNKLSVEEGGRILRKEFFERVREKFKMNKIAVGHTLTDKVETFLLNIARGSGRKGILNIQPKTHYYIRPLIEIEREEIRKFLKSKQIPYKVDTSNYSTSLMRNFVRLEILPKLKELHGDFLKNVNKLTKILQEEEVILEEMKEKRMKEITIEEGEEEIIMKLKEFLATPIAIKRRMIKWITEEWEGRSIGFEEVENIINYIEKSMGKIFTSGKIKISKNQEQIRFYKKEEKISPPMSLPIPGEVEVNGLKVVTKWRNTPPTFPTPPTQVYFDHSKLCLPLWIRSPVEGDKFVGFGYTKKLSRLLIDEKIPKWERKKIPLLVDNAGNILWVIGYKRSGIGLVTGKTQQIIEVKVYEKR